MIRPVIECFFCHVRAQQEGPMDDKEPQLKEVCCHLSVECPSLLYWRQFPFINCLMQGIFELQFK